MPGFRQPQCERGAPVGKRAVAQVPGAIGQEVEGDVRRRALLGEHRDAGRRGVDPEQQRVEVQLSSVAITISPSSTNRSFGFPMVRSGSSSSGKYRFNGFRSRLWM